MTTTPTPRPKRAAPPEASPSREEHGSLRVSPITIIAEVGAAIALVAIGAAILYLAHCL